MFSDNWDIWDVLPEEEIEEDFYDPTDDELNLYNLMMSERDFL